MADLAPEPTMESVASLPDTESHEPVPSSAVEPKKSSSSIPPPSKAPLGAALATSSRIDGFLSQLFRCLQTRAGADTILLFLMYSTRVSSTLLDAVSVSMLKQSARRLVSLLFQLPPETTVVVSTPPKPAVAAFAMSLSQRLKAASGMISEWRAMGRLFGLLGLYFGAKRLVAKARASRNSEKEATAEDRIAYAIGWTQIIALVSFQLAENIVVLANKKIISVPLPTQGRLVKWSARSWATYIGLELGKLLIERSQKGVAATRDHEWNASWNKNFINSMAWFPLTVQWSLANGPFPDWLLGPLGCVPATNNLVDLWRSNA